MSSAKEARVAGFRRLLGEMAPYRFYKRLPIRSWLFSTERGLNGSCAGRTDQKRVDIGFQWDRERWPVWFSSRCHIPSLEQDERLWLRSWFGGESCFYVDGNPYGEINAFHREVDLSFFADGNTHLLEVQTVPYGLFGAPEKETCLTESVFLWKSEKACRGFKTFEIVVDLIELDRDRSLTLLLEKALDKAFGMVFGGSCDSVQTRNRLIQAGAFLEKEMVELSKRFPKTGEIWAIGHAHIDYAWLWPEEETRRKTLRTFSNAMHLLEKYPDFVFGHSSAQVYQDVCRSYPDLFEDIHNRIREGRWEPLGGMWVESDCTLPDAESLIRQFVYGQRFWEQHFGMKAKVCWLPDTFGFSWILPQILSQAGIELFVTTKMNWNDTNRFPFDLCRWRGIDGSEVIYHSFYNPTKGYNGPMDLYGIWRTWEGYRQKGVFPSVLYTFGHGDGGGGPTDEMLETWGQLAHAPGMPKIRLKRVGQYLDALKSKKETRKKLPLWDHELYLEIHRGTLTSQSRTKRLHKQAESILILWESLSAQDAHHPYPYEGLDEAWKCLLKHEFHDILPGTSIAEVYETTHRELQSIIDQGEEEIQKGWIPCPEGKKKISVINPSPWPRVSLFYWDGEPLRIVDEQNTPLMMQPMGNNRILYWGKRMVQPFETRAFDQLVSSVDRKTSDQKFNLDHAALKDGFVMQNRTLRVEVLKEGSIRMEFLPLKRKVFPDAGNLLKIFTDVPCSGDAWNINLAHLQHGRTLEAERIEWIHHGPICWSIRVHYKMDSTRITQDYSLYSCLDRLDIHTKIDWQHRRTLLKAIFPTSVLSRKARFDLSAGYIERPTHRNTSWDTAKYEVAAHRWCDISQRDFGVAILNDGLYGHSVYEGRIALSLVKSGVYPDFFADEGLHSFTYSIFPHLGDDLLEVMHQAHGLNHPLYLHEGIPKVSWLIKKLSAPNLRVLAIKKGIDGKTVLRVAEMTGSQGQAGIEFSEPWSLIEKATILEDVTEKLGHHTQSIQLSYRPYEIITLLLTGEKGL